MDGKRQRLAQAQEKKIDLFDTSPSTTAVVHLQSRLPHIPVNGGYISNL